MDRVEAFYHQLQDLPFSFQRYGWESKESQEARFFPLLDYLSHTSTLLDFGCAEGDLYQFLLVHGYSVVYTGLDRLPFMIERARKKHPRPRWLMGDIHHPELVDAQFDVVFASGLFNHDIGNNYEMLMDNVIAVLKHTNLFVVNMLSDLAFHKEVGFFYYSATKLSEMFQKFSIRYIDGYLPNDMTFCISK